MTPRLLLGGLLVIMVYFAVSLGGPLPAAYAIAAAASHGDSSCLAPARGQGRTFYIDPTRGSDANDGSAQHPWRSLQFVFARALVGSERRVIVKPYQPPQGSRPATPPEYGIQPNPKASIKGGDTILLGSGAYGRLTINGPVNTSDVTIAAAPGARPYFDSISIAAASHLSFRGLAVRGPMTGPPMRSAIAVAGAVDHIHFDNIDVGASTGIATATPTAWAASAPNGILLRGDCLTLSDSRLHDVRTAIAIYQGTQVAVRHNRIANFSDDGIDFNGSGIALVGNQIVDHWPNDGSMHPDCIQGQARDESQLLSHVTLEHNVCIERSRSAPNPSSMPMMGIDIFDGRWTDMTIRCNLVINGTWNGVAAYGVDHLLIERNVVIGTNPSQPSWIMVRFSKTRRAPVSNTIRYNVAMKFPNDPSSPSSVTQGLFVAMAGNRVARLPGAPGTPAPDGKFLLPLDKAPMPLSVEQALARYPLPRECAAS